MSPAQRSSRIGRAPTPTIRATAMALAALLAGGGQTTLAAPLTPEEKAAEKAARDAKKEAAAKTLADAKVTAAKAAAVAEAAAKEPIPVVEGGRVAGQKTA